MDLTDLKTYAQLDDRFELAEVRYGMTRLRALAAVTSVPRRFPCRSNTAVAS